ncbi:uncharacterized protein LOC124353620 isoform X2 [Homalodisca vitripennis]|uniref:uncharacterized protein LOC124353620 isoform X2 n=1 Tax=Homalodisca vitripennis TaxID=197043 RepID=UPI001EEBA427|nr:uncharacterized protein LOC124353620 isoform X2 [Homalodisca vitripennis]
MNSTTKFSSNKLTISVVLYTFLLYEKLSCFVLEKCSDDTKCNGGARYVVCGICGYSKVVSTNICLRPFRNLYDDIHGGACKRIEDHCKRWPCDSRGTSRSYEGYGLCRCQCKNNHYGSFCANSGSLDWSTIFRGKKYTSGVQVLVELVVSIDTFVTVFVMAQSVNINTTKVILSSGDGMLFMEADRSVINKESSAGNDEAYCYKRMQQSPICKYFSVKVAAAYELRIKYPYQGIKDRNDIIQLRDVARGYVTSLFADIYDKSLYLFTVHQTVLVLYPRENLPCIPTIVIENCKKRFDGRRIHGGSITLSLRSSVYILREGTSRSDSAFRVNSGCPEAHNYMWEAWRIIPNLNMEEEAANYTATSFNWHLKPNRMFPGIYMIKLSVSSHLRNFAVCYLEIVEGNYPSSRKPLLKHRGRHRYRTRKKERYPFFRMEPDTD